MASEVRCMIQQQLITNKLIITSIIPKLRPLSPSYGNGTPPKTSTLRICCSQSHSHFVQPHHQRRSAHYQPTIWSYDFVQSLNINDVETYEDEVKKLEEEVKCMLTIKNNELDGHDALLLNKLELVDEIQRLGLGYRFKEDIKEVIDGIFFNIWDDQGFDNATTEKSLCTAALGFRLLRHHGYQVSQDIFKSFKDDNGDFQECICKDVKGMLSLYEASFLAFEGENLLDEAKAFTSMHLQNLIRQNANTSLAEEVNHALELPLHQRMQRLEARWYIESYSKRSDVNQLLLQLAKLDFNMAQSTLQKELKDMSRWWKGLGLANKLSFSRDRLMECFFWALGMVNEPQFSNTRKELTKVAALITVIDDVYDVYGTLDELELFTNAVERWNVNIAVTVLPDYMKLCFLALYNTVNEMVYETLKEQGQNSLSNLTKAWADMCKAFLVEAKWSRSKYTPTFEEYIENGWISVSGVLLLVHAYFLVSENISNHGVDCLEDHHNLLRWPSIIFRLSNDLGTSAAEIQRGETANSISCSMRQNHHSEESARKCLHGLMEETWKKMNMEIADVDSPFTKPFLDTAINLARISRCTYQYGDGHGAPDTRSKNRVLSLIIDPIQ